MLKKIVLHETLLNLMSFRFHMVVGLFAIVFFGGLFVSVSNYKARLGEYDEVMAAGDAMSVAIPPNPLGAFAEGMDQYSSMSVSIEFLASQIKVKSLGKSNVQARLSTFDALDFNFAVRVLLSLGAIIITFASVSGERFAGTLKLAAASGVSRRHMILGKLCASFISLAAPLVICLIVSAVALAMNGMLTDLEGLARVALFGLFSLVYLLFFLLLGITVSIATRRPQESLVTGVLCWLVLVFVLPAVVPQAAKLFADLPSARGMEEARLQRTVGAIFERENSAGGMNGYQMVEKVQTQNDSEWELARNLTTNYARVKNRLDLLSPADIYNDAGMGIVGNGVVNALHAKASILQHKTNTQDNPRNAQFVFYRLGLARDLGPALLAMFILCLEISVLLVFAYRRFMALDLREG
jgi:ABC-type transport system involved in multi-copper enzyme maturation permease subunit